MFFRFGVGLFTSELLYLRLFLVPLWAESTFQPIFFPETSLSRSLLTLRLCTVPQAMTVTISLWFKPGTELGLVRSLRGLPAWEAELGAKNSQSMHHEPLDYGSWSDHNSFCFLNYAARFGFCPAIFGTSFCCQATYSRWDVFDNI